jgi:hypothetical protein
MTCTVCTKFDKAGTFITGCRNFKRDSINQHEKSEGMISPRLFLTLATILTKQIIYFGNWLIALK